MSEPEGAIYRRQSDRSKFFRDGAVAWAGDVADPESEIYRRYSSCAELHSRGGRLDGRAGAQSELKSAFGRSRSEIAKFHLATCAGPPPALTEPGGAPGRRYRGSANPYLGPPAAKGPRKCA